MSRPNPGHFAPQSRRPRKTPAKLSPPHWQLQLPSRFTWRTWKPLFPGLPPDQLNRNAQMAAGFPCLFMFLDHPTVWPYQKKKISLSVSLASLSMVGSEQKGLCLLPL